jgi:hypothetical protein
MRLFGLAAAIGVLAGCGGGGPATKLSNFTGTPAWAVQLTASGTCDDGSSGSQTGSGEIAFTSSAANELEYTNTTGCAFKFNVSGNTATLSNAPVKCSITSNGQVLSYSFSSYTATTTDGHSLTLSFASTGTSSGVNCRLTGSGLGTR